MCLSNLSCFLSVPAVCFEMTRLPSSLALCHKGMLKPARCCLHVCFCKEDSSVFGVTIAQGWVPFDKGHRICSTKWDVWAYCVNSMRGSECVWRAEMSRWWLHCMIDTLPLFSVCVACKRAETRLNTVFTFCDPLLTTSQICWHGLQRPLECNVNSNIFRSIFYHTSELR